MSKKADHLTNAGINAGSTYCGAPREEEGKYCHMPYVTNEIQWTKEHVKCSKCLEIVISSYD